MRIFSFWSDVNEVGLSFLLGYDVPSVGNWFPFMAKPSLEKKLLRCLETSETNYPVAWRHIPEQEILQCQTRFVSIKILGALHVNAASCIKISVSVNCLVYCVFFALTDVSVILYQRSNFDKAVFSRLFHYIQFPVRLLKIVGQHSHNAVLSRQIAKDEYGLWPSKL